MNGTLKDITRAAEGRYLMEAEKATIRAYATGMADRLETMRRVEERESQIVGRTVDALKETQSEPLSDPTVEAKVRRDVSLTIRYIAQAHVREDPAFFRVHFAEWFGELLCAMSPPKAIADTVAALRAAMDETLDGSDSRHLLPYVDLFLEEVHRWT